MIRKLGTQNIAHGAFNFPVGNGDRAVIGLHINRNRGAVIFAHDRAGGIGQFVGNGQKRIEIFHEGTPL